MTVHQPSGKEKQPEACPSPNMDMWACLFYRCSIDPFHMSGRVLRATARNVGMSHRVHIWL